MCGERMRDSDDEMQTSDRCYDIDDVTIDVRGNC